MDERACIMSKKYDQLKKRIHVLEDKFRRNEVNTLVDLSLPPIGSELAQLQTCNYAQEYDMNTATVTVEKKTYESERRSLRDAVFNTEQKKDGDLREHYNIDCVEYHNMSPKELVDAIKSDKFKFRDDGEYSEKKGWFCNPLSGICFCDPDKKPNHEDYYKARDKMIEDAEKVRLDISVLEPADGLKSYRKFEERTYH
jgi:hypothetical protein